MARYSRQLERITGVVVGKPGQTIQPSNYDKFVGGKRFKLVKAVTLPDDGTGKEKVSVRAKFVETLA